MAKETVDRQEGFMSGAQMIGALMSQSARDLAYTTNNLIDSGNAAALKNAERGLRLVEVIDKVSGGRLTWEEHQIVEHNRAMLLQSLDHHASMLAKSESAEYREQARKAQENATRW